MFEKIYFEATLIASKQKNGIKHRHKKIDKFLDPIRMQCFCHTPYA